MRKKKQNVNFITPPPAQLYALSNPEDETFFEKTKAFLSGVRYIFVLALMLWWIPIIGQCIAGYLGGRRAGSPYRGLIAAAVPVLAFVSISFMLVGDPFPMRNPVIIAGGDILSSVSSILPFLVPYLTFSSLYVGDFLNALHDTATLNITIYTVVIASAFIGGLMADQAKREMRSVFKTVTPVTVKIPPSLLDSKKSSKSLSSMKPVKATASKKGKGTNTSTGKKSSPAKKGKKNAAATK